MAEIAFLKEARTAYSYVAYVVDNTSATIHVYKIDPLKKTAQEIQAFTSSTGIGGNPRIDFGARLIFLPLYDDAVRAYRLNDDGTIIGRGYTGIPSPCRPNAVAVHPESRRVALSCAAPGGPISFFSYENTDTGPKVTALGSVPVGSSGETRLEFSSTGERLLVAWKPSTVETSKLGLVGIGQDGKLTVGPSLDFALTPFAQVSSMAVDEESGFAAVAFRVFGNVSDAHFSANPVALFGFDSAQQLAPISTPTPDSKSSPGRYSYLMSFRKSGSLLSSELYGDTIGIVTASEAQLPFTTTWEAMTDRETGTVVAAVDGVIGGLPPYFGFVSYLDGTLSSATPVNFTPLEQAKFIHVQAIPGN